ETLGVSAPRITAAVRTGDTTSSERAAMLRTPPHILVTTPESLYLLVTAARSREMLRTVRTVIVDEIHAVIGGRRGAHLALSHEVWEEYYDRLTQLISEHKTTLVFVNTRKMAERTARHLSDRLGEEAVTAHHGSLSKEIRLNAEHRLKTGALKALVATASLELGIDIGHVDLV